MRATAALVRAMRACCLVLAVMAAASPRPAAAGAQPLDTEASSGPLAAAEAYHAVLREWAPGMVTPLMDYSALDATTPACDTNRPPVTRAVLVGASDAGGVFGRLSGPENDVALLVASLQSRGVKDEHIFALTGPLATRPYLAQAFGELVAGVNCGDRVLFYFSGSAARATDVINIIMPEEVRRAGDGVSFAQLWEVDYYHPGHEATAALRWAQRSDLFLALNGAGDGVFETAGANDISELMTRLRNRMVDVAVVLDTSFASLASLAERQQRAGDNQLWTLEIGAAQADGAALAAYRPAALLPNHGGFAALYSSIGDSHSIELGFDDPDGSRTTYGVFTFRLANAIQNRGSVTVRTLAESLKVASEGEERQQRHRVEASDPEMALFSDGSLRLPPTDPITITEPTPKRGAAAVERPEIRIAGRVDWSSPARAVMVDGRIATLLGDGSFSHTLTLKSGLNTVEIVALTRDGRTHEKRLEFMFEGDRKALEGEGVRYAVVIANQTYARETGFSPLRTPFADADALADILATRYGFRLEATLPGGRTVPLLLKDATRRDIETVLYQIGLVAGEKDTVLIYFAGHGIYEEKTTIAFWVPVDAEAGVPISYLSASTIVEAVQRMHADNVVVISDSCFSGALMRGGGEAPAEVAAAERMQAMLRLAQRRTRVLISSGGNEPVEDLGGEGHSVFARALLTGLDRMEHEVFSARELFDGYILPMVVGRADQEPQYRPIERAGHEGGDIVFVRAGG